MPWKDVAPMDERVGFIAAALAGHATKAELCRDFRISRKTGYKWLERYKTFGLRGLEELSRAPKRRPWAIPKDLQQLLLQVRVRHPNWGPRKILVWMRRHHKGLALPAPSSVGALLRREGLIEPRSRRHGMPSHEARPGDYEAANRTWCADFKGHFRVADGRRCDPLTVTDGFSRFLLCCQSVVQPTTEYVQPVFEAAFREYGMPDNIRTDNGPPFASRGIGGLTRLSVWWIKLGIRPDRIQPGRPQQNGRHERMHRTLKAETVFPPAANLAAQQRRFDRFKAEYNNDRPHEALGYQTPVTLYSASGRPFPRKLTRPEYPGHYETRIVRNDGTIKWHTECLFLSQPLMGEPVGLEEVEDGRWVIRFGALTLAVLDETSGSPSIIPASPL